MSETLIDKLKRRVIEGASKTADYVEDRAKLGKLHLDLMAERRKLNVLQAELGAYVYEHSEGGDLTVFAEDQAFARKLGAITESLKNIEDVQEKIQEQKAATAKL